MQLLIKVCGCVRITSFAQSGLCFKGFRLSSTHSSNTVILDSDSRIQVSNRKRFFQIGVPHKYVIRSLAIQIGILPEAGWVEEDIE